MPATAVAKGGRTRTSICLDDITVDGEALAHHQQWWRKAPGGKWLVRGNHDVDPVNQIRPFEIDRTAVTLYRVERLETSVESLKARLEAVEEGVEKMSSKLLGLQTLITDLIELHATDGPP